MVVPELYEVPLFCSRCFWRPAIRLTAVTVRAAQQDDPDTIYGTVKCERKSCRDEDGRATIIWVTAATARMALPERPERRRKP